ncbi:hypothetical protein C8J57DRAFT_1713863 [Mycena rebaudengoi]|nr:hypothetical protein C8J57DRAFT_1197249 [Mycena rebaudengoi]KAJ7277553.1 hypothetical protein C8J57DRAFT_1713863 [Mycena rebaudengoi]
MSSSEPLPPALVAQIIEGYARGIRSSLPFLLSSTVFGSMLIPLLLMLFALSTPQKRRKPIFILNVVSVCLGIITAAMTAHMILTAILSPFDKTNITEHIIYTILQQLTPWVAEGVLMLRIAAVFPRRKLPVLLAFPVAVKITRIVLTVIFGVQFGKLLVSGYSVEYDLLKRFRTLFEVLFIMELLDNSYMSALFLWRLRMHREEGKTLGRVSTLVDYKETFTSKLQTLFWIVSTNFIFPLIFGVIQIITIFVREDIVLPVALGMVNSFVAIISTVFATIWSSTLSFKEAIADTDPAVSTPILFRPTSSGTTPSEPSISTFQTANHTKPENWDELESGSRH